MAVWSPGDGLYSEVVSVGKHKRGSIIVAGNFCRLCITICIRTLMAMAIFGPQEIYAYRGYPWRCMCFQMPTMQCLLWTL